MLRVLNRQMKPDHSVKKLLSFRTSILVIKSLLILNSYTFQNIQDNAFLFWKFHRVEVIKEFWDRPTLPSPFNLIENTAWFCQWFCGKKSRNNLAFSKTFLITNLMNRLYAVTQPTCKPDQAKIILKSSHI